MVSFCLPVRMTGVRRDPTAHQVIFCHPSQYSSTVVLYRSGTMGQWSSIIARVPMVPDLLAPHRVFFLHFLCLYFRFLFLFSLLHR